MKIARDFLIQRSTVDIQTMDFVDHEEATLSLSSYA